MAEETSARANACDILKIDQPIVLTNEEGKTFTGFIDEIGERLVIYMRMPDELYVSSPDAGTVFLAAVTEPRCTYRFETSFIASTPLPIKVWYVEMPMYVTRQQARHHVRIPMPLPMRVKYQSGYGNWKNPKETNLVDLSGSGICFVSEGEVDKGTKVTVEVDDLPLVGTLRAIATVQRCKEFATATRTVYRIGCTLDEHLARGQEDKLIKALFKLQREFLQRGLGV
ncbi:hypothetical protein TAMA11512_02170 [Selenomonas sp. TAMA-11512]|uniref:flagellar brake protein n=1 Tax=Selenomonas sp. TAMA-11512 TaxID=3095337 RepID=UPI0030909B5E|nr:hypothetical protein TAMA11512_02170 [Selenomonas sp. TAMA-11512]